MTGQPDGEVWTALADARARARLRERIARYARGTHVTVTWRANATGVDDPFHSLRHSLRFHRVDAGGSFEVDFARRPDGLHTRTLTRNHDFDPTWSPPPTVETEVLDEAATAAAAAAVEGWMLDSASWIPFPAILPRASRG